MEPEPEHRSTARRWRRRLAFVAAAAAAAVAGAACSSAPSTSQVASLGGTTTTTSASGATSTARTDAGMIGFARCLRHHGVAEPDPAHRPGHAGLTVAIPPSTRANEPALNACTHLLGGLIAAKQAHQAALAPNVQALTNYAQCMRNHDIDMLDPNAWGALNLGNVPGITADFGRYSPQFRAADHACRHLLPRGVHDDGTGP